DGSNNEPLIGATIMPVGGGQGVATDADGKFTLKVPANVKQAKVSYVGYATQTVAIRDNMVVKLASSDSDLDELVVLGYGSAKKLGSVVGSVAVVGEKQLENIPTATFIDALQGQVAGLSVLSSTGEPGAPSTAMRIRGVNSLQAGNTPLFILDGAPVSSTVFTTLNPNDIQSITVLKDAASVAIYGSRAANGVVVITSKKGAMGEAPKVTVRANYGWSQMVEDGVEMMSSQQYIEFRDKIGIPVTDEVRNLVDKYGISTNWRDEIFRSAAPTYSVDASLRGGSEIVNYYLSLNHFDQDGIVKHSNMRRETLKAALNVKVNNWLRVGLQTNLGYTKYETTSDAVTSDGVSLNNPMVQARTLLPYDSPYYYHFDENGNIVYGDRAARMHYSVNKPYSQDFQASIWNRYRTRVTANANLYEQINPIEGLTIRAQQAVDAYDARINWETLPYESFTTPMGDHVGGNSVPVGSVNTGAEQQSFSRYYSFTYTNTAEYTFNVNDMHNFTVLAGEESIISKTDGFGAFVTGYTDKRTMLLTQGVTVTPSNLTHSIVKESFNSLFFKLNYDFDNRYFFEATYRRDGSSKFAPGHRWANFFSVGGMWNAKNEKFLEPVDWLNELNVRISYGTTGNSSINNYLYFGTVGPYANGYGQGQNSWGLSNPANPDLTWETVKSFDVGLHFKVLNILSGDIDFYKKTTTDMLMNIPWSYTTGFGEGTGNIGSMTNTGVDVSLNADIVRTKDWYWGVRANFNYNKNEITELFNGRDYYTLGATGTRYEVGHSAGEYYVVRYVGVDPRDGKQMWLDKNDNITKVFNEERDAVMTGKSLYAPWNGGFGTNLRWKGLALQLDFVWAAKKYMMNNDAYFMNNAAQGTAVNQTVDMLDVWTKPGDITMHPGPSETVQFDDRLVEDASFMRLKNLTLTYSLPSKWMKAARLDNVTFHFTGRNLWTVTKYTGFDPEPSTNMYQFAYPNTRQYELGVEVTF
ncbi:MAG: TonB-dependent receptor, partial [Muribaculaceae bacterium]|nr:TonB-dependent receptor [Muribaculaceae bacterium]